MTVTQAPAGTTSTMRLARDVEVPVGGGHVLRANLYRPTGSEPVPLLVTMGPYGKDVPMAQTYPEGYAELVRTTPDVLSCSTGRYLVWEVPDPERWTAHGYAVAHLDARGTGGSPGTWAPMSKQEARDFAAAVDWFGEQGWCNGHVAVLGVSYHAMAAWRVAAEQPRHLSAVVPWYGAGDAFREAWRHGGILSNAFADTWWYRWVRNQHRSAQRVRGSLPGAGRRTEDDAGDLDAATLERSREDVPAQVRQHELYDAWADGQAVDWSRVRVPFLSVAGLSSVGLHLRGNVEGFTRAASSEKWLRVLATRGSGIERFYGDDGFALQRRFLDHYCRGGDEWTGTSRVVCEARRADGTVRTHESETWPPETSRWTRLHLDADTRNLAADPPTDDRSAVFWSAAGDGVTFRSARFERGGLVIGPCSVSLEVSTTAPDADLFVGLGALDGDGVPAGQVARGWLRLSHRELDEEASSTGHPVQSHARLAEVRPGDPYAVEVELWPASAVLPPGGSLVLTLAGTDPVDAGQFRHDDPDDRASARFAGWTTVRTGPDAASFLTFPLTSDE